MPLKSTATPVVCQRNRHSVMFHRQKPVKPPPVPPLAKVHPHKKSFDNYYDPPLHSPKSPSPTKTTFPKPMSGGSRRQSVTAQLSRQARRFSTAIAPAFTKIEPLHLLQKTLGVEIRIADIGQFQRAVEQYVLRNAVLFDPVEFDIYDKDENIVLKALLFPEEMSLYEGTKKICDISLSESEDGEVNVSKVKHPVSGMTVYEMREIGGTVTIQGNTDDLNGCRIVCNSGGFSSLLTSCGCSFSRQRWSVIKQDVVTLANITPKLQFFGENALKVEWVNTSDNELRLIALSFALCQMVRDAFPSLYLIVKEFRHRRA